MLKTFCAFVLLLMTFAANAISVAQYRAIAKKGGDNWEITKVYVGGLGAGMAAATYASEREGKGMLFCPPRKLALEQQNYLDILDKQIKELEKMPLIDDMNIEVVLTFGLESTFPCTKSN